MIQETMTVVGLGLDAAGAWFLYRGLCSAGDAMQETIGSIVRDLDQQGTAMMDDWGSMPSTVNFDRASGAIVSENVLALRGLLFLLAGFAYQAVAVWL